MRGYLLDSHILLWLRLRSKTLPQHLLDILEDSPDSKFYSIVSPWELSIKHMKKKLQLPDGFFATLSTLGMDCLPVQEEHLDALRSLPPLHHDPFDRMLVAQAMAEKMTLITRDENLTAYPIKTLLV